MQTKAWLVCAVGRSIWVLSIPPV